MAQRIPGLLLAAGLAALTVFPLPAAGATEEAPAAEAPEPAGALSLDDALAAALLRNPELQAFSWETRAAEARALQAGKIRNPDLEFRLDHLYDNSGPNAEDPSRKRVFLSQDLELGKRGRRVDLANAEKRIADLDYEAKRGEVEAAVKNRFFAVLGAERRVASWSGFASFVEEMRTRVSGLVETGSLRSIEVPRVERRLGLAKVELETAKSELAAARLRLAATWGSGSPKFSSTVGDLESLKPVPSLDAVQGLARGGPAAARAESEKARGEAALALAKSGRVPDIKPGIGVRWDTDFGTPEYLFDFRISLPVFDRKQGDIAEAEAGLARVDAERRAADAAAAETIALYYYPLVASDAKASTLRTDVLPAARSTFEAYRQGIDKRIDDPGDVIDARRDLVSAEIQYTDALVACHQARAALEGAVGASLDSAPTSPAN